MLNSLRLLSPGPGSNRSCNTYGTMLRSLLLAHSVTRRREGVPQGHSILSHHPPKENPALPPPAALGDLGFPKKHHHLRPQEAFGSSLRASPSLCHSVVAPLHLCLPYTSPLGYPSLSPAVPWALGAPSCVRETESGEWVLVHKVWDSEHDSKSTRGDQGILQ